MYIWKLPPFTDCHENIDTVAIAVLWHFDPDLLNCSYNQVIAPVKSVTMYTLSDKVPQ